MRALFLLFSLLVLQQAQARGYQASISAGMDNVRVGENRQAATFGQLKISTMGRLFRIHSSFTGLTGTDYLEGEAAVGLHLYLLTPFITKRAPVFPFLFAEGTFGVGRFDDTERMDAGYGYGAGVDLKLFEKSGITIGAGLHAGKETTLRYQLGFYWMSQN